jgi:hypothetical protein
VSHKTHSNAWGEDLPEETRRQLYAYTKPLTEEERDGRAPSRPWLRDFDRDVLPYLSLQGIVAPSRAGWYRFLGRMREQAAARTIIGLETSKRIAQGMADSGVDPRLAADVMTSLAVDEAAKPEEERNEKVMKIFAYAAAKFRTTDQHERELALKAAAQQTKDEQLKLAREKFEAAERRLAAVQGAVDEPQLSDAERVARIKGIFGMK